MSVANLLVPNNLDIYCNNLNVTGNQSYLNGYINIFSGATTTTTTSPKTVLTLNVPNNNGGYGIEVTCVCYVTVSTGGHLGFQVLQTVPYIVSYVGGTGTPWQSLTNDNTLIYGFPNPPTQPVGSTLSVSGTTINIALENGYAGDTTDWFYQVKVFGEIL
jgi:hypothetical protein